MSEPKKIIIAHVIADQNPEVFRQKLEALNALYEIGICDISTTPVMVGAAQGRADMVVITSAYIEFTCTEEQAKTFRFQQQTLLRKT
jgi:ribosomal protein L30E